MLGARRHRFVAGTIVVLLAGLASGAGQAQDTKLLANCAAPQPVAPGATPPAGSSDKPKAVATVSCQLRATDAVTFNSVKANVKGRSEPLEVDFAAYNARDSSLTVMFLVQMSDPARRGLVPQMTEAVVKMADARENKRRFAAYSVANDLNLVADFDASKSDFERQVRTIRGLALPSQLYKATLEAIAKLAKEAGDRKALVILGDGMSDDTSYDHEQVVKAAKDAGVVIHALGYLADAADLPKFQILRRLADDTGGFRREVRVAGAQRYTITNQFVPEVLENGGSAKITLTQPPGPVTVAITADFGGGRSESVDHSLTLAPPPAAPALELPKWFPQPATPDTPASWYQRLLGWMLANTILAIVIGAGLCLGAVGLTMMAISGLSGKAPETESAQDGRVYGWLDMLDGNASRYPLRTTNVRIGRHRDNDICLHNDSISRRHALLHFNADNRRFVITDLGGDNGVIVNKIKQQSHELNDGDLVELGEVRLRFRTNMELTS